jgi:division protein CdvB (Snf7/Vps24/ESCRT-III family)
LAEKIVMDNMSFDKDEINKTFNKIESLKQNFDVVEKDTALINKRETLLGVAKTSFSDLRKIQDDLKPLYELWVVASKIEKTMPIWVEGKFDTLDAAAIE